MTRNLVMRTMADGGQCHPCIHLRRCDSLAWHCRGVGEESTMGQGRVGRGEGGLRLLAAPSLPCLPL